MSNSWQGAVKDLSSANYTIKDADGYDLIRVTTGAADRTITLPTAADNKNRVIEIYVVDDAAGNVIIDGEGAETIQNGWHSFTTMELWLQGDMARLICDGSGWIKMNPPSLHMVAESGLTAYTGSGNPTVAWVEWDWSAAAPPGTLGLYGFFRTNGTDAHYTLLVRDSTSAATNTTGLRMIELQHAAVKIHGYPIIWKAKNGIFDLAEQAATRELVGIWAVVKGWLQ